MKITYEMPELFTALIIITSVIIFTIGKMAPEEKVTKQKTPILKLKQEGQRAENKLTVHNTLLFFCRHKNPMLRHTDIVEQKKENRLTITNLDQKQFYCVAQARR